MGVHIRLLTAAELSQIETLELGEMGERFMGEQLSAGAPRQTWGLWVGKELAAFVEVVGRPPRLWIARIGVALPFQRLGYGSLLLNEVVRELRRRARIQELRAAVHQDNFPARHLFEKAGFQQLGEPDSLGEIVYSLSLR